MHRIAITQAHYDERARTFFLDRRRNGGDTTPEAIRALKRRLSDVVYRALLADATPELRAATATHAAAA